LAQIVLKVEGMSCNHCKMTVEKALRNISGVESVQVNLAQKEVVVSGSANRGQLVKAVEEAGYTVIGW